MSEPDAELREVFQEEVAHRLDEIEAALLAMIDSLFRNVHTIKGTAGMFGLDEVTAVAHAVEDILAVIRDTGTFPPSLLDPLLHATGVVRSRVNGDDVPVDVLLGELTASLAALKKTEPGEGAIAAGAGPTVPAQDVRGSARGEPGPIPEQRSVRVAPAKIDHLLDVIGEAVSDQARTCRRASPMRSARARARLTN